LIDRGVRVALPIACHMSGRGLKEGRDHKIRKIADQVWTRYKRDLKIKTVSSLIQKIR